MYIIDISIFESQLQKEKIDKLLQIILHFILIIKKNL